ncbi:MAG: class II aldolase/adducin family protein [Bacteroidetes bacterium]|nr:class II aldolase/adducin family protein [Bacteroidota bacterium]
MADAEIQFLKENLLKTCRRLAEKGFVAATDGNISARLADGRVLVTPSARNKADVENEELIIVGMDGRVLEGIGRPSTEFAMHSFIYGARPDVRAVVHAHPPFATAFAAARIPLDGLVFPEVIVAFGKIPLAEYATPSTPEVAASIEPLVKQYNAIMLSNHGVVTCGASLDEAYDRMEKTEHTAKVAYLVRQLGGAKELSRKQVEELASVSERSYGKKIDLEQLFS